MKKSFPFLFLLFFIPSLGFSQTYCTPTGTNDNEVGIFYFEFGNLSSFPDEFNVYANYSDNNIADVVAGSQVGVLIYPGDVSYNPIYVNLFIDYNGDGDFDDDGEWAINNMVHSYPAYNPISVSGMIDESATADTSRIRVVLSAASISSACGDLGVCNVQDYGIHFIKPWYQDADGDGFGNPDIDSIYPTQPEGYVSNNTDCDDNNNQLYPGAVPIDLSVSDITTSTALATWTEGCATQWRTRRRVIGQTDWTYAVTNTNSRKLREMEAGTEYEVQVRAFDSDSSDWSASQTFSTLSTCTNVTNLSVNNITETSANLKWTIGSAVTKRIRFREVGSETWTPLNTGVNATHRNITGLNSSTTYEWQVKTLCSATDITAWSELEQFTTSAPAARTEQTAGEGISAFSVYPNPGAGLFTVTADFDNAETVNTAVTDILGRTIYSTPQSVTAGENSFTVNLTNQAAGIYFLKITSASGMLTQKIMIQ